MSFVDLLKKIKRRVLQKQKCMLPMVLLFERDWRLRLKVKKIIYNMPTEHHAEQTEKGRILRSKVLQLGVIRVYNVLLYKQYFQAESTRGYTFSFCYDLSKSPTQQPPEPQQQKT